MKKYNIRIPENLQICINTQEKNDGLVIKLRHDLWAIVKRQGEFYGIQLLNPEGGEAERGRGTEFNLTKEQISRVINKLIKKPGYGYGKNTKNALTKINKIIKNIKNTYV